jgi:hypothetical protein
MADETVAAATDPTAVALEKMRTTTQWLMGALGAIGAALIAGVQLSPIGALSWSDGRLAIGLVAFVVALGGVARLLQLAGAVLSPDTTNLDDLASWQERTPARERHELRTIAEQLEAQPWLFAGWGRTVRDLQVVYEREVAATQQEYVANWNADLEAADERAAAHGSTPAAATPIATTTRPAPGQAAGQTVRRQPGPKEDPVRDARILRRDVTARRATTIDGVVRTVVQQAHFLRFKARFAALMRSLLWWGATIGAATFVVAWAASPPNADGSTGGAAGEPAVLDEAVITLTTPAADELGDALGDGCDLAAVPAVILDSNEVSFSVVSATGTGCRPVRFEVTCATGVVRAETTAGELERVGPRCS